MGSLRTGNRFLIKKGNIIMRMVLEHYGLGLLGMVSMVLVLELIFRSYSSEGIIAEVIENYFITLCGTV